MKLHSSSALASRAAGAARLLALFAAALSPLSAPAAAQQLLVGGSDSVISRTVPVIEDFEVVGASSGSIQSMVSVGDQTFIGEGTGAISVYSRAGVQSAFPAGNDATALAANGTYLFVGGSDGTIERYTLSSYSLQNVWNAPAGLRALVFHLGFLYAAGDSGEVFRADSFGSSAGSFGLIADVGVPVTSIAADGAQLVVGSANGVVNRIDIGGGTVTSTFSVGTNITAMGFHLDQLLVAGSEGIVRRVDPMDGTTFDALTLGSSIRTLALTQDPEPAFSYCYGLQCPCGNEDPLAGCANSTGRGARLAAAGTTRVSADDLALFITSAPAHTTAIVFMGQADSLNPPLGDGILCIGGPLGLQRFGVRQTNAFGSLALTNLRQASAQFSSQFQIDVGASWRFQAWFRDTTGPCGSASNSTNSSLVTFTP